VTVYLIARNTFREVSRDRMLFGAFGAGAALLAATQLLAPLALGEGIRLTVDMGLSGISIIGLILVLLVGTSLVSKEIDRRTIYNLLSRPLARHTYLLGKWAGLTATLWIVAFAMGMALAALLAFRGHGEFTPGIAQAVYMAALELAVVTAVAVMFSAVSTPVLSALYTTGFYMVGQWSYDLRAFASKFPPGLASACQFGADLVPNLPVFNMRTTAAMAQTASFAHLGLATAYAAVYCACALCLATASFESRDFK
jgi:ABC-type transport system involved in multi-copper enzyme maturation permease subunit